MKIQLASDIHLEFHDATDYLPPPHVFKPVADRDLLILAGDIGVGTKARNFIEMELETSPVVYVPGNHEYYHYDKRSLVDNWWNRFAAKIGDMHYLIKDTVEMGGVHIAGTPWYSDFWGKQPSEFASYRDKIADFYFGGWTPEMHAAAHKVETEWLRSQAGADIVVTHWPPTKEAIHPRYIPYPECKLNAYFVNDHEDLVREIGAKFWCSGHTHEAYDYEIGGTRCIGNPTGYPFEDVHSRLFKPDYVFEI